MPDSASVNRSLGTIRTELEFLRDSGIVSPPQYDSIMAQLPENGQPSQYVDPKYGGGGYPPQYQQPPQQQPYQQYQQQQPPFQQIAQDAQNPQNPAHPQHPNHHQWVKSMGSKFGNAMMWGAGATFGGDMVNDALKHF